MAVATVPTLNTAIQGVNTTVSGVSSAFATWLIPAELLSSIPAMQSTLATFQSTVSSVGSAFASWSVPASLMSQMDNLITKAGDVRTAISNAGSGVSAVGGKQFGGLVTKPGMWRLAEKGVPEMVIPMQQTSRNIGLLAQAAQGLGLGGAKQPAQGGSTNVQFSPVINVTGAPAGREGDIAREIERVMQDPVRTLLEQLKKARDEEHRQSYV